VDRINEMLAQLAELAPEQLQELESSILSEFDSVEAQDLTPQSVEALESLANAIDAVRTEQARRTAEAEALASKAAEAVARVKGTSDAVDGSPSETAFRKPGAPVDEEEVPLDPNDPNAPPPPPMDGPPMDGPPADGPPPVVVDQHDPNADDPLKKKKAPPFAASNEENTASNDSEGSTELAAEETPTAPETPPVQEAAAEAAAPAEQTTEGETLAVEPEGTVAETTPEAQPAAEAGDSSPAEATAADDSTTTLSTDEEVKPETEASTETPSVEADITTNTSEAAVTAAATGPEDQLVIEPPADRQFTPKATATVAITAGADIPGVSAGSNLKGMDEVADSFVKRLHTLRRVNGGDGEQHIVASLNSQYPEERVLTSEPEENWDKIQKVVGPEALVASGGWCAPLETRYDLFDTGGSTSRPVKDSLPSFSADRGGIRYMTAPALGAYTAGIALWTAQNDVSPNADLDPGVGVTSSGPAVKPCVEVECGVEMTAVVDAITLCLQFGNLMTRAYPELVKRHNELALVQHARFCEDSLLEQIEAGSTAVTAAKVLGAVRDFLVQVDKVSAAYRHRYRLDSNASLRVIAPLWLKEMLKADIVMQMPGDGLDNTLGIADAKIQSWFSARGINPTWHLDGPGWGAQGTGAMLSFPTTVEWCVFVEGTWLHLDAGTLDLGIIRDSGLVGTNDYKMFVESFEGLAKMGPESLWITSQFSARGVAAALVAVA
jgi:hypothetical protein